MTFKNSFDDFALRNEIEFRRRSDLPSFVPGFVSCDETGYKERIIDGRPLARISDGFEAYRVLTQFNESQSKCISVKAYTAELTDEIDQLLNQKADNAETVKKIMQQLLLMVTEDDKVVLTFSHGDLQAGNIWVENETNHIYIIDWKSWSIRSE